jgi:hypothetical protein
MTVWFRAETANLKSLNLRAEPQELDGNTSTVSYGLGFRVAEQTPSVLPFLLVYWFPPILFDQALPPPKVGGFVP